MTRSLQRVPKRRLLVRAEICVSSRTFFGFSWFRLICVVCGSNGDLSVLPGEASTPCVDSRVCALHCCRFCFLLQYFFVSPARFGTGLFNT